MKNTTKYKGVMIQETPSEKYPELVTLVKTQKKLKSIEKKMFLTLEKAQQYIDKIELELWESMTSTRLEKSEAKVAKKELLKLG
jgi:nicotinamide mononucleotide adenylyltransferase